MILARFEARSPRNEPASRRAARSLHCSVSDFVSEESVHRARLFRCAGLPDLKTNPWSRESSAAFAAGAVRWVVGIVDILPCAAPPYGVPIWFDEVHMFAIGGRRCTSTTKPQTRQPILRHGRQARNPKIRHASRESAPLSGCRLDANRLPMGGRNTREVQHPSCVFLDDQRALVVWHLGE